MSIVRTHPEQVVNLDEPTALDSDVDPSDRQEVDPNDRENTDPAEQNTDPANPTTATSIDDHHRLLRSLTRAALNDTRRLIVHSSTRGRWKSRAVRWPIASMSGCVGYADNDGDVDEDIDDVNYAVDEEIDDIAVDEDTTNALDEAAASSSSLELRRELRKTAGIIWQSELLRVLDWRKRSVGDVESPPRHRAGKRQRNEDVQAISVPVLRESPVPEHATSPDSERTTISTSSLTFLTQRFIDDTLCAPDNDDSTTLHQMLACHYPEHARMGGEFKPARDTDIRCLSESARDVGRVMEWALRELERMHKMMVGGHHQETGSAMDDVDTVEPTTTFTTAAGVQKRATLRPLSSESAHNLLPTLTTRANSKWRTSTTASPNAVARRPLTLDAGCVLAVVEALAAETTFGVLPKSVVGNVRTRLVQLGLMRLSSEVRSKRRRKTERADEQEEEQGGEGGEGCEEEDA